MLAKRSWVAVAFVCIVEIGCKKARGSGTSAAGSAAAEGGGSEADLLGLYVQCFNEVEHSFHDSWHSYTAWVDPAKGPTGKEERPDGINQIDDYQTGKCLENLKTAIDKGPATGPLAAPTLAYVTAFNKLKPLIAETKLYYDHKDYKDDAFAKGKELNTKLAAAYQEWDAASDAVRAVWDTRHRAVRDQDLAALEKKEGRKSERFVTSQVMNTAEQLIEAATAGDKPDPQGLQAAITTFQTAFAEMDTFFGPALTASTDTDRYVFKQQADGLLTQTKEVGRVLKSSKPLPEDGDGSLTKLLDAYNRLVDESNQITWD